MRQKDDKLFAKLLNRLREGNQTEEDLNLLSTREVPVEVIPQNATHLFQTNSKVNLHNTKVFAYLTSSKVKIPSQEVVTGDATNAVEEKILKCIPHNPQKTMGLTHELSVGTGQRVDLCLNVAVDDGLIKGASGIVKFIEQDHDGNTLIIYGFNLMT